MGACRTAYPTIKEQANIKHLYTNLFKWVSVYWEISSKVTTLGVVAGCDDMLRHDPNMMSRSIHTIYSSSTAQLDESFFTRFKGLTIDSKGDHEANNAFSSSRDNWESIRGAGLAPVLHAQYDELKLPFIAWVKPCAEGNNVLDAAYMATKRFHSLRVAPNPFVPATIPLTIPFALPTSWNQLLDEVLMCRCTSSRYSKLLCLVLTRPYALIY
ncbi:hypothetical protein PsorP6_004657 [Peronosclerospora sorghi]|uniref:Uncharacterized protein n=1 Tax=Peronosclerospora sorghi TaxID=230839 RepID=A0ACC0VJI7_9STRA|nr:hypothetical protein PsorP6_004657 [Peronosclerospora sorghi]